MALPSFLHDPQCRLLLCLCLVLLQFYFLKPTHSLFGFFTALADAYSAVLMPDKDLRKKLGQDAGDR